MSGNRHARRAAEARNRKRARNLACHNNLYKGYFRHLPQIPLDAPFEPGRVYHTVFHHDEWCRFYETKNFADCNCQPDLSRHVEPVRS